MLNVAFLLSLLLPRLPAVSGKGGGGKGKGGGSSFAASSSTSCAARNQNCYATRRCCQGSSAAAPAGLACYTKAVGVRFAQCRANGCVETEDRGFALNPDCRREGSHR